MAEADPLAPAPPDIGPVYVDGVEISIGQIQAEAQFHPAASRAESVAAATRALVVRQVLLNHAQALGIQPVPEKDELGRTETGEEAMIRGLLDQRVDHADVSSQDSRRFYDSNRGRFISPTLYEASHILYAVERPADLADAKRLAQAALERLGDSPGDFEAIARQQSDCGSAADGGRLGQFLAGEMVPGFEAAVDRLEPGEIGREPVTTEHGLHVVRLDGRVDGRPLPFDAVRDRIESSIARMRWHRSAAGLVKDLVNESRVQGFSITNNS